MIFKFKHLQKIVGLFVVIAALMIVVLLMLVARGQRWFQGHVRYTANLQSASGLKPGSLIVINDLEAGRIGRVVLDSNNRVEMQIQLFDQYADRVREGSSVRVLRPIVGSAVMALIPGDPAAPALAPGSLIPTEGAEAAGLDDLIEQATSLIAALGDPKGDLMLSLANVSTATKGIVDAMTKNDSSMKLLLERRDLYDKLSSAMGHLNHILGEVDKASPEIRDAIVEARRGLEEVNKVTLALQKSFLLRGNIKQQIKQDSTLKFEARP